VLGVVSQQDRYGQIVSPLTFGITIRTAPHIIEPLSVVYPTQHVLQKEPYGLRTDERERISVSERPRSVRPRLMGVRTDMAKRVLVADDHPLIRKLLCQLFEREEDYDLCAEAENGQEAIELALKHRPDLIILDFVMPILNGLEAARRLKKIMPDVPIILFTQHATGITLAKPDVIIDRVVSKGDPPSLIENVRSLVPAR